MKDNVYWRTCMWCGHQPCTCDPFPVAEAQTLHCEPATANIQPSWACPYCDMNQRTKDGLKVHLEQTHQLTAERPAWKKPPSQEAAVWMEDGDPTFEGIFADIFMEAMDLLVERQHKYGPENIEGQGIFGIFTRMRDDKMSRLARSMQGSIHNGVITVDISGAIDDADTFEDACLDIANYALIMLCLYRGLWGAPLEEEYDG